MLDKWSIHLDRLSASVGNIVLELLNINASLLKCLEERSKRALGAVIIEKDILRARMHVVFILFVD